MPVTDEPEGPRIYGTHVTDNLAIEEHLLLCPSCRTPGLFPP